MSVKFTAEDHKYTSLDENNPIEYTSVTTFIKPFKPPFDQEAVALKCSKNKKNKKYYGKDPKEIIAMWEKEAKRATDLGTWYHEQREKELLMFNTITREGRELPIIAPRLDGDIKLARDQVLTEGVYPEHIIFLKSAGLAGQADRVEVVGDKVNIYDYKTNKEITTNGFTDWQGNTKMMLGPCSHLEDCHINHYALQLSTYMYMILKHNHYLNPGKMEIHHVIFEVVGEDQNGYPIIGRDANGDPIVLDVVKYELEYKRTEVINMIKHMKKNKQ